MTPEQIAAYAAMITSAATLAGGLWAFLNQREQLRLEREKARAAESSAARREDLDALRTIIDAQARAHADDRVQWHAERAELHHTIAALQNELDEFRGRKPRNRNTGPLGA